MQITQDRKRRRVATWLASVDDTPDDLGDPPEPDIDDDGVLPTESQPSRLLKRARAQSFGAEAHEDFLYPYDAPDTPPLTDAADAGPDAMATQPEDPKTPQTQIEARRKRGNTGLGDTDNEETPTQLNPLRQSSQRMAPPPKKQRTPRTPSPKKSKPDSRSVLDQLQKPVQVYELPRKMADALAQLPPDIKWLYQEILLMENGQNIPHEVSGAMAELIPVPSWCLREPDPEEGARAIEVFNTLTSILDKASQAQTYKRHEAAWYIHVHSPLLELVFDWRIPQHNEATEPRARVEPVMSATIAGNSIPLRRGDPNAPLEPACSVSLDTELLSDTSQESCIYPPSDWSMSQVRSHSAKVDFVVALDIPDEAQLRKTISWTIDDGWRRHINQTTYEPLKESPIAISFEMKTEAGVGDSFAQLGIWAAAWHKRMYDLRERLVRAGPKPCLVSMPLVQVRGHQWNVFFACDRGTSIDVYGPLSLGSTDRITSIYNLLRSLEAMKRWVVGTYYDSMKQWFLGLEEDD
ncbi:hypothetical protein INS49_003952 [Diaporthe citri]|uniref:uncharacterized protein n=1 Tax=Diaporthe citri TaxID=83186 RepID=UPI001C7ECDE4|nr:uncharacterized protein INS49_003952 [Diaporthe citri]KAG6354871.1 hypothetical protein INS49_003952 [Diaporthe citri]